MDTFIAQSQTILVTNGRLQAVTNLRSEYKTQ
ncbi:hypothetical protein SAMN05216210_1405 [Halopseudomonas salegens]|uniref:Uncharacterized protein n=1 Tax=Halopseudomonas salegens TaxID=1434072 RepID=A0A1H2FB80_9GAMM|nr:hypothetical protein SAMN05216210_1405 [Halopseudomonas salegens]